MDQKSHIINESRHFLPRASIAEAVLKLTLLLLLFFLLLFVLLDICQSRPLSLGLKDDWHIYVQGPPYLLARQKRPVFPK